MAQLPRFTLAAEVDDNAAASKTLNNLMVAFNKEARAHAAENAPDPKPETGKAASAETAKARRTPPPAPEFKQTPTNHPTENSYVLNIPATLARQYPAGFRPTIRLKDKQLIVSTTPESARLALEVKAGQWAPPVDLAPAFEQLPNDLTILGARDPRSTLPEVLAGLPGAFQRAVNAVIALSPAQAAAAEGGGAPAAGGAGPMLVFKIPMTRLPKADELRERLFPGLFSISTDDQGGPDRLARGLPQHHPPVDDRGLRRGLPRDAGRGPEGQGRRIRTRRRLGHDQGRGQAPGPRPARSRAVLRSYPRIDRPAGPAENRDQAGSVLPERGVFLRISRRGFRVRNDPTRPAFAAARPPLPEGRGPQASRSLVPTVLDLATNESEAIRWILSTK